MKLKYLLPAAMLATAMSAAAVPAWPGLMECTLEDGTPVQMRLHGDEFFNYKTDAEGYLLEQGPNGLRYMKQGGMRVMATPEVLKPMIEAQEATPYTSMLRAGEMKRMGTLDNDGRTTFPTLGDVHFLVLLVQFDDYKFVSPTIKQDMQDMLNKEGYDVNGCRGSVRDYYITTSGGKFTPTFDVSDVITLPKTSGYYVGNSKYDNIRELVSTAIDMADEAGIDFTKYCYEDPNTVDAVVIWYAGYGQADTPKTDVIWPHSSTIKSMNKFVDGKQIGQYCCFNELNGGQHYYTGDNQMAGIGTPLHEFGHTMGMPDLYDPNYSVRTTPGAWSLFDNGPYNGDGFVPPMCSGYERWVYRWIEYTDAVDGTHYELTPLEDGGQVIRIPIESSVGECKNEYFLIESRKQEGWDYFLPGSGMLIWHIDYTKNTWLYNQVNSDPKHRRCYIIAADGSANPDLGNNNAASAKAAWPQDINYITPDTRINLPAYYVFAKYDTANAYITSMAFDINTGVGSFDYNVVTESPSDATVMHTPKAALNDYGKPANKVEFSWDPVEGATGYQVSMWRINNSGKTVYESGLEEKEVGNVTNYVTPAALSNTKWGMEYHATVRVVKGIPSTEISNEVVFTPSDLEVSGVEVIDSENQSIIGLKGAIYAPAAAEIYNMQGVRCPAEGLEAGIYLVRYNGTVTKVIVK